MTHTHTHTHTPLRLSASQAPLRAAKAFPTPPVGDECFSPTSSSCTSLQEQFLVSHARAEDHLGFSGPLFPAISSQRLTHYFKTHRSVCLGLFPALLGAGTPAPTAPPATRIIASLFCQNEPSSSLSLISPHLSRAQILNRPNSLLRDLLSAFSGIGGVLCKGLSAPFSPVSVLCQNDNPTFEERELKEFPRFN